MSDTIKYKVYHAHGFVIHNENSTTGEEVWTNDSAFSEVFFDFEKAKTYLLKKFENLLAKIHWQDNMLEWYVEEERDIKKASPEWRREYIEDYIRYKLIISELNSDSADKPAKNEIDFTEPERIDWHLHCNGEVITRFYVFGEKKYECRESDLLPEAGTKFKKGDLVIYKDCENKRGHEEIFVVLTPPDKPIDKKVPWTNKYRLVYIDDSSIVDSSGRVEITDVHEDDLMLCNDDYLNDDFFKDTILSLQWVVKDEANFSPEKKAEILRGVTVASSK